MLALKTTFLFFWLLFLKNQQNILLLIKQEKKREIVKLTIVSFNAVVVVVTNVELVNVAAELFQQYSEKSNSSVTVKLNWRTLILSIARCSLLNYLFELISIVCLV